jgi:hypothetical protein
MSARVHARGGGGGGVWGGCLRTKRGGPIDHIDLHTAIVITVNAHLFRATYPQTSQPSHRGSQPVRPPAPSMRGPVVLFAWQGFGFGVRGYSRTMPLGQSPGGRQRSAAQAERRSNKRIVTRRNRPAHASARTRAPARMGACTTGKRTHNRRTRARSHTEPGGGNHSRCTRTHAGTHTHTRTQRTHAGARTHTRGRTHAQPWHGQDGVSNRLEGTRHPRGVGALESGAAMWARAGPMGWARKPATGPFLLNCMTA